MYICEFRKWNNPPCQAVLMLFINILIIKIWHLTKGPLEQWNVEFNRYLQTALYSTFNMCHVHHYIEMYRWYEFGLISCIWLALRFKFNRIVSKCDHLMSLLTLHRRVDELASTSTTANTVRNSNYFPANIIRNKKYAFILLFCIVNRHRKSKTKASIFNRSFKNLLVTTVPSIIICYYIIYKYKYSYKI